VLQYVYVGRDGKNTPDTWNVNPVAVMAQTRAIAKRTPERETPAHPFKETYAAYPVGK